MKLSILRKAAYEAFLHASPALGKDMTHSIISLLPDECLWRVAYAKKTKSLQILLDLQTEMEKEDERVKDIFGTILGEKEKQIPSYCSPPEFWEWMGVSLENFLGNALKQSNSLQVGIQKILEKKWKKISNFEFSLEYMDAIQGIFFDFLERILIRSGEFQSQKYQRKLTSIQVLQSLRDISTEYDFPLFQKLYTKCKEFFELKYSKIHSEEFPTQRKFYEKYPPLVNINDDIGWDGVDPEISLNLKLPFLCVQNLLKTTMSPYSSTIGVLFPITISKSKNNFHFLFYHFFVVGEFFLRKLHRSVCEYSLERNFQGILYPHHLVPVLQSTSYFRGYSVISPRVPVPENSVEKYFSDFFAIPFNKIKEEKEFPDISNQFFSLLREIGKNFTTGIFREAEKFAKATQVNFVGASHILDALRTTNIFYPGGSQGIKIMGIWRHCEFHQFKLNDTEKKIPQKSWNEMQIDFLVAEELPKGEKKNLLEEKMEFSEWEKRESEIFNESSVEFSKEFFFNCFVSKQHLPPITKKALHVVQLATENYFREISQTVQLLSELSPDISSARSKIILFLRLRQVEFLAKNEIQKYPQQTQKKNFISTPIKKFPEFFTVTKISPTQLKFTENKESKIIEPVAIAEEMKTGLFFEDIKETRIWKERSAKKKKKRANASLLIKKLEEFSAPISYEILEEYLYYFCCGKLFYSYFDEIPYENRRRDHPSTQKSYFIAEVVHHLKKKKKFVFPFRFIKLMLHSVAKAQNPYYIQSSLYLAAHELIESHLESMLNDLKLIVDSTPLSETEISAKHFLLLNQIQHWRYPTAQILIEEKEGSSK